MRPARIRTVFRSNCMFIPSFIALWRRASSGRAVRYPGQVVGIFIYYSGKKGICHLFPDERIENTAFSPFCISSFGVFVKNSPILSVGKKDSIAYNKSEESKTFSRNGYSSPPCFAPPGDSRYICGFAGRPLPGLTNIPRRSGRKLPGLCYTVIFPYINQRSL